MFYSFPHVYSYKRGFYIVIENVIATHHLERNLFLRDIYLLNLLEFMIDIFKFSCLVNKKLMYIKIENLYK